MGGRNRRVSTRAEGHLESEVSEQDAEGLLTFVQATSSGFHGFTADEVQVIACNMSIMSFESEQTVLEKGQPGSWFGILLEGTLKLELPGFTGPAILRHPGDIIGEMAMWHPGASRTATIKGHESGLLATMLVSELPVFVNEFREVGLKLMRLMGKSAIGKSLENSSRARSKTMKTALGWDPSDRTPAQPAESVAALRSLLGAKNFAPGQIDALVSKARFYNFGDDELLLQDGQGPGYGSE